MNTKEILVAERERRIKEIASYDFNIEQYRRAVAKLDSESHPADMGKFKEQLQDLIQSETYERTKSAVMLSVIADRLEEMGE